MKYILSTLILMTSLSACGTGLSLERNLTENFNRDDVIRVYTCALTKENATGERFSLEAKLAATKILSNESWASVTNLNRKATYNNVNTVARKYGCF